MRRAAEDCGKQKKADTCSAFFYVGTPRALRFGQDVRMMNELDQLVAAAQADFAAAATPAQLENAKARYLGKAGRITEHLKALAALSPEDKKAQGAAVNAAKQRIDIQSFCLILNAHYRPDIVERVLLAFSQAALAADKTANTAHGATVLIKLR